MLIEKKFFEMEKKMVFDCIKYNKIPNNCKYIIVNFEVYVISFYTNKMIQHRIF